MQKSHLTKILTVGFLGLLLASGISGTAGIAHASEVTGSLASNMETSTASGGTIAGTVTGGRTASESTSDGTSGGTCTGTCYASSTGGPSFFAAGGGSGVAYTAIPVAAIGAPAAGGPVAYDPNIAYTSYPDYSSSDTSSDTGADTTSAGSDNSDATSTLPGVPSTGGTLSPGESLMAASATGGMSTAAAIAIAILGVVILGGAAYGINSVYRKNRY
ncbi:MAG TPA: hypothetical protein VF438_00050 [Candidatus Paceibacterota bacterium]